jgi:hypothetical protein
VGADVRPDWSLLVNTRQVAATQHSLPSGRYSLLGPDLHRLDRTSFAWRTAYSMTSPARVRSVGGSVSPMAAKLPYRLKSASW